MKEKLSFVFLALVFVIVVAAAILCTVGYWIISDWVAYKVMGLTDLAGAVVQGAVFLTLVALLRELEWQKKGTD